MTLAPRILFIVRTGPVEAGLEGALTSIENNGDPLGEVILLAPNEARAEALRARFLGLRAEHGEGGWVRRANEILTGTSFDLAVLCRPWDAFLATGVRGIRERARGRSVLGRAERDGVPPARGPEALSWHHLAWGLNPFAEAACFVSRADFERLGGFDESLDHTVLWDFLLRLGAGGADVLDAPVVRTVGRLFPGVPDDLSDRYMAEASHLIARHTHTACTPGLIVGTLFAWHEALDTEARRPNVPFHLLAFLKWVLPGLEERAAEREWFGHASLHPSQEATYFGHLAVAKASDEGRLLKGIGTRMLVTELLIRLGRSPFRAEVRGRAWIFIKGAINVTGAAVTFVLGLALGTGLGVLLAGR